MRVIVDGSRFNSLFSLEYTPLKIIPSRWFLLVTVVFFTACAGTPEAASTPLPTDTPQPTNTPEPTATSTATPTEEPTSTPTPVPLSAFAPDEPVIVEVNFDNAGEVPNSWFTKHTTYQSGIAKVEANPNWDGIFSQQRWVSGQTVLISFRYVAGSVADLYISAGQWETPSFRQWGILNNYGYIAPQYWEGTVPRQLGWQQGYVQLVPDRWYVLMIHIGSPEQEFVVRIWDQEDPTQFMETRQMFTDPSWENLRWNAVMTNGPVGGLEVDRFEVIEGLPDLAAWDSAQ